MFLMPDKMAKIRIIISRDNYKEVLSYMYDLGVMQINEVPEDVISIIKENSEVDFEGDISQYSSKFKNLKEMLIPIDTDKKYKFESLDQLKKKADSVKIYDKVSKLVSKKNDLSAQMAINSKTLDLLSKIDDNIDLRDLNNEHITSYILYSNPKDKSQVKDTSDFISKLKDSIKDVIIIPTKSAHIIAINKDDENEFGKIGNTLKISIEAMPKLQGKVHDLRKKLSDENKSGSKAIKEVDASLKEISKKYFALVAALDEEFEIEAQKYTIISKLGITNNVMVIEGWLSAKDLPKLDNTIKKTTSDKYVLQRIDTNEVAPTKLDNKRHIKLFEEFIKFYSLPMSNEFDPTFIFAIVFPIFFGLMIGDAGYGLTLLIIAFYIIHTIEHPKKKNPNHKSNPISSFVHSIVGDNGLMILAKSIIPGSIIAIIMGIVFNEYFGFHMPFYQGFNLELKLSTILLVSGWIGVFMITFGMVLGFINLWRVNNKKHAIAKIGWILLEFGIVLFGLMVLRTGTTEVGSLSAIVYYIMIILGISMVLGLEGGQSLIEVPSLISNILSYTRLVGILLASVILAGVIDTIFIGSLSHSILFIIFGFVILILGQVFTFIIAMFEPGIQGARLIYVEFFSNFYKGNGSMFKPYGGKRSHTLGKLDE